MKPQLLTLSTYPFCAGAELKNYQPSNVIDVIKDILSYESSCPAKPKFMFELSEEATMKNYLVMKQAKLDLGKAIEAQSKSPLGYGSEFKRLKSWNRFSDSIQTGNESSLNFREDRSGLWTTSAKRTE